MTEQQAQALKEAALKPRVSIAELIRQGVDLVLEQQERAERWRRASALVGEYRQPGPADVSVNHDRYLFED